MNTLSQTAKKLVASGKGILAADESMGTCAKRFEKYGIPETPEMRRKWRELLFTTTGIESGLSGVILFDETIRQATGEGLPAEVASAQAETPFAKFLAGRGILPGIKVDQKTEPFAGSPVEEVTKGLSGLSERLREYVGFGAKFTKWRAVIRIKGPAIPTAACLTENARRMAEYAVESQKAGLVPMVEPEVLLDGDHNFTRCEEVVRQTLTETFAQLKAAGAAFDKLLLKTSMVLPGKESGEKRAAREVAKATVRVLMNAVPKEVAGIVFLSGGQTPQEATERLSEIVKEGRARKAPWPLTFSYSRALQDPVLAAWAGKDENIGKAQEIFARRVQETARASEGKFA